MNGMVFDIAALVQVVLIDLALAGDNAVAVGLAASALPGPQQRRVILVGIALALVLRIGFALFTVQLLHVRGVLLIGGLMLLWVAWRMWSDLQSQNAEDQQRADAEAAGEAPKPPAAPPSFARALLSVIVADVSMSFDNILTVAAVARETPEIMAFGLVLSVLLMGVAASAIAAIIHRHRWIALVGIAVILAAAVRMIWEDGHVFLPDLLPGIPQWLGGKPVAA
jgi:YjbE family integral membrane protein